MGFMRNLWVKEGAFGIFPISSIEEGIAFLAGWPLLNRSAFFYMASNALRSAEAGSITEEEARSVLRAFCQEAGVLVEIMPPPILPKS